MPVASIELGLLVLVGVTHDDRSADAEVLATKIADLRIFPDPEGKMNRSVAEVGGAILVVSQFTLYGDVRRGRRPSFVAAADPSRAAPLVSVLGAEFERRGLRVETGRFGEMMEVDLCNEGPVTILLETRDGRLV
jgi:D-tyrosyl-tRNA(Tyr) deacylase